MNERIENLSKEQIEGVIQLFDPFMEDYLYVMDLKHDYYRISAHAVERFLLPSDSFDHAQKAHLSFVYEEDHSLLINDFDLMVSGAKKVHNLHYRWLDKNGTPVWINCRGRVLDGEDGKPRYLIGCISETGKEQRADNTSGLLSKLELSMYVNGHKEKFHSGFLMQIGIDDFSSINNIQGSLYGDYIIKNVAERIQECLQENQKLFHIVADEYMIVDFSDHTAEDAMGLYKKIQKKIAKFVDSENYKAVFTVSAGIVVASVLEKQYGEFLRLADFSMKQAKLAGKNSGYIFDEEDYKHYLRRTKIATELHHSVKHGFEGFEAYYQPIVDSDSYAYIGAETLMRFSMKTEDGVERITPIEFIPILEETGLIIPAGRWILDQAFSMCSEVQERIPGFRINVNISYIQVIKSDVLKDIVKLMEKHNLPPECVGIELTESGYLDSNPHFLKLRNGLKKRGIKFIIDDFGTGYSNLHCLSELNPAYIKIDRNFTNRAMCNTYDHELMIKIIEMAHSLDLQICVEGVEEKEVLNDVRSIHADYIQGYLFGKPCSRQDFYEQFL